MSSDDTWIDEVLSFGYTDPAFIADIHWSIGGPDKIAKAKQQIQQRLIEARVKEVNSLLSTVRPLSKHSGDSWNRGYVSAQIKLREIVKTRLAQLSDKPVGKGVVQK